MRRAVVGGVLVAAVATSAVSAMCTGHAAETKGRPGHRTQLTPASEEEEAVYAAVSSHPQPMLASVSETYQAVRLWPRSDALVAAREALDRQCEGARFHETPFREFVTTVAEKAGVRLSLDKETLDAIGFDADTPVTADLTGLSFRAGLREVLEDVDLAYVFKNDHVEITSEEKASSTRETVFYPVIAGVDAMDVAALIEETVSPDSWSHRGGPGSIVIAPAGMGHGLIVSHNATAHEQIEATLTNLDSAIWTAADQDEGVTALFVRAYVIDDDDVREGLEERLLDLCNTSLPHGRDADARIEVIGRAIVVQSRSRPFQVMAASIIAAINGEDLEVELESDDAAAAAESGSDT